MKLKIFLAVRGLAGQTLQVFATKSKRQVINVICKEGKITIFSKPGEVITTDMYIHPMRDGIGGPIVENTYVVTAKQGATAVGNLVIE